MLYFQQFKTQPKIQQEKFIYISVPLKFYLNFLPQAKPTQEKATTTSYICLFVSLELDRKKKRISPSKAFLNSLKVLFTALYTIPNWEWLIEYSANGKTQTRKLHQFLQKMYSLYEFLQKTMDLFIALCDLHSWFVFYNYWELFIYVDYIH